MLSQLDYGIGLRLTHYDSTAFLQPGGPAAHKRADLF